MDLVLIILWCELILMNGMNAAISFRNDNIRSGVMYILCSCAWTACVCMKVWILARG